MRVHLHLCWLGAALTASPAAAQSELVLEPGSGHIIDAWINNQAVRLRVDPETPGYVILNGEAAFRAYLSPAPADGAALVVGPVRVSGANKIAKVSIGGATAARRVVWTDGRVVDDADGIISPALLPHDRVTLRLRAPAEGETAANLPMRFDPGLGLFHAYANLGTRVAFRVSTARADTLATAAAGALLAGELDGTWSGEPRPMMVKYDVVRPVRPLTLAQSVELAGRPLTNLVVRTADHRGYAALPADVSSDPEEILVTAMVGSQPPRYMVSLGLDWLAGCSSITWDNRERRMTLRCAPAIG